MEIEHLYHWSPRDRRESIERHGLTPFNRNMHSEEFLQPSISFSPSPTRAWHYSHGTWKSTGTFDLWEVRPEKADDIQIYNVIDGEVVEVRIRNPIPAPRLFWVGEKTIEKAND